MRFLDLCARRQSTRRYASQPVPRESLERCLEAARLAPSACNSQPWEFIVIDNPAEARKLAEAAFSGVYAINTFVKEAPALVTVVTQQSVLQARLGAAMRNMEYRLIDIGVACEHFVLQADEEGLGTCWLGWLNEKAVKKFLGLPRSARVHIMISVGYPGDTTRREKVRRPLDEVRRYHGSAAK